MLIGYARTSTTDQDAGLEAQRRDLEAAGCERIFHEQVSSVGNGRHQLATCPEFVREGDALVITRVDSTGAEANGESRLLAISADGGSVAFASVATNLVANDTDNTWDIFVHDRSVSPQIFPFNGFFPPVDNPPTVNVVAAIRGSTSSPRATRNPCRSGAYGATIWMRRRRQSGWRFGVAAGR